MLQSLEEVHHVSSHEAVHHGDDRHGALSGASAKGKVTPKEHKEFHAVDFNEGWQAVPGYPDGFERKILAGHLDEARKKGSRTTLLRIKPGVYTTAPVIHTFWEEVYVLSGDVIVGNDKDGNGGERFLPNTYACRPPGVPGV